MSNWTNKWVIMLLLGIIIQTVIYPAIFIMGTFVGSPSYDYMFSVFLIGMVSIIIQIIGFAVIMNQTKDTDPALYSQGRPFRHKLREEDEVPATRKPTFDGTDQSVYEE